MFQRAHFSKVLIFTCVLGLSFLLQNLAFSDTKKEQSEVTPQKSTVLLITADSIKSDWKTFADWKTRSGKSTKIITVETIKKEYKADISQHDNEITITIHQPISTEENLKEEPILSEEKNIENETEVEITISATQAEKSSKIEKVL